MEILNIKQLRNYVVAERVEKLAICKLNSKGSFDYDNRAGSLRKMLLKEGIKDPVNILDYFEVIDNPFFKKQKEVLCKLCNKAFKNNKSGHLTRHILKEHKLSAEEYLERYPEEISHFRLLSVAIDHSKFLKEDTSHYIECSLCKSKMKKITRTHIEHKHSMTVEEFKKITGLINLSSEHTRNKSKVQYHQRNLDVTSGFNKVSKEEKELREFLQTVRQDLSFNRRKYIEGKEIDIFIPELNIGIEYNGLYYHSEKNLGKGRKYHLEKTLLAEKNNIHLVQIFSDEWKFKKDIVKSKLRSLLSKDRVRVHARKCTIREISPKESSTFLKKYHIQGEAKSNFKYGAFYKEELIAVATFSKPRTSVGTHKKVENTLELVRLAIKDQIISPGLLSRFLHRVVKDLEPTLIYSYADRRWTFKNSNIYLNNSFKLVGETAPSYWYSKYFDIRYHRYTFAKHKLKQRGWYIEGKTEWEIMQDTKFDRIWDCGNLKYEWRST